MIQGQKFVIQGQKLVIQGRLQNWGLASDPDRTQGQDGPMIERFKFPRIIGRTARNTVRGCEVTDFVFSDVMGFQGGWVLCRSLELA